MSELTETLPVVALRGMTILPDMVIHFDVSRERSVKAIEEAMLRDQRVFLVTQKDVQVENPGPDDLYRIGTIASVKQVIKMPQKIIRVLAEGLERGELSHFSEEGDYLEAEIIRFEKDRELEGSHGSESGGNLQLLLPGKWQDEQGYGTSDSGGDRFGEADEPGADQPAVVL